MDSIKNDSPKFTIQTLGCKVNQYESNKIKETLLSLGFTEKKDGEEADLQIINTCTVTHLADKKSRQKIRQAAKLRSSGMIIVTGCGVDNDKSKITSIGEDFIMIPNKGKETFADTVKQIFKTENHFYASAKTRNRNRAFLKIGDGCDRFCSYCIVPYVRGPIKTRAMEEVLSEADSIAGGGCREIVLTAIHLGAYGSELKNGDNLSILLENICKRLPEVRLRLSSLEPLDFSAEILESMKKHPQICRHIHLPLQHASDSILKAMNRNYTKDDFRKIVNTIRESISDVSITTDIIVGFPGETEDDFNKLKLFVKEMNFLKCHIFKYSQRTGTKAVSFTGQIDEKIKSARSSELIAVTDLITEEIHGKAVGTEMNILVEGRQNGLWTGFSSNYMRAWFRSDADMYNKRIRVKIERYENKMLIGKISGDI